MVLDHVKDQVTNLRVVRRHAACFWSLSDQPIVLSSSHKSGSSSSLPYPAWLHFQKTDRNRARPQQQAC